MAVNKHQRDVEETRELFTNMCKIYYKMYIKSFENFHPKWSKEFKERYTTKALTTLIEKNREALDIMKIEKQLIKKDIYRSIQEEKGMKSVDIGKMIRGLK